MTEYRRFGLVFTKTRVYKFGHRILCDCERYATVGGIEKKTTMKEKEPFGFNEDPDPGSSMWTLLKFLA